MLALAFVGVASASTGSHFRGETKQGFTVTFRTTAKSEVGFKTSVSALCVSIASGRSHLYIYPVLLQPPHKLASRQFKITFTAESSTHITITGSVKAGSASGSIDVRDTKTLGATSTRMLDIGACSGKTIWTARKV